MTKRERAAVTLSTLEIAREVLQGALAPEERDSWGRALARRVLDLAELVEYYHEHVYVAMGGNGWGKGFTIDAAKKACRENYGKAPFHVWKLPPGAFNVRVNHIGAILWDCLPGCNPEAQAEEL